MFESNEFILTVSESEALGELGWTINGINMDNFDSDNIYHMFDGRGVAHDIVEHVNGPESIGTIMDEFQAIGAIWFTRGQVGDLQNFRASAETILGEEIIEQTKYINDAPFGKLLDEQPETDWDDVLQEIIEEAREFWNNNSGDYPYLEDMAIDEYFTQAFRGMQVGIIKQEARFDSCYKAFDLYTQIRDMVNKNANREYEGQEFKIIINNNTSTYIVRVFEHYPEDDFYPEDEEEDEEKFDMELYD